jgi:hypothetical protein
MSRTSTLTYPCLLQTEPLGLPPPPKPPRHDRHHFGLPPTIVDPIAPDEGGSIPSLSVEGKRKKQENKKKGRQRKNINHPSPNPPHHDEHHHRHINNTQQNMCDGKGERGTERKREKQQHKEQTSHR